MRLNSVPVTPAPPRRPLATAVLTERRAVMVRPSFSTEIALAEGKLNRSGGRHSHGLHSAIEFLLFTLAEAAGCMDAVNLGILRRAAISVRPSRSFDFPYIDVAARRKRCVSRRQRRQNRGNTVTLCGQVRNPGRLWAAPENLAFPMRSVALASGRRKHIPKKRTPLFAAHDEEN
jgi:hypothetical protein